MINFIGKRKIWYFISLLLLLPGIFSLFAQGLNLGIDFAGGNLMQFQFEQQVNSNEIRALVEEQGIEGSSIRQAEGNQVIIRTKELPEAQNKNLIAMFEQKYPGMQVLRNEKVGAVIGRELTMDAIYALIIASVLIIIYISFRFQFWFGIAAIIALLHDVFITLGIFSIFQIEVDSAFVAAVLTIIGYSINDTIVVFDRIRENLNIKKKEPLNDVVNISIKQTIFRSLMTSITVIAALVALLFWGGETTKIFAMALLIGTISGTYSSIFTASPLWVDLTSRFSKTGRRQSI